MAQEKITEKEMKARLEEIEKVGEFEVAGQTSIDDAVIASIVGLAAREVKGVASLGKSSVSRALAERLGGAEERARGVEVETGKKEAIIDLTITVLYGYSIPEIVVEVRKKIASHLLEMAGLIAKEVNVSVAGIEFPERMPGKVD